MSSSAGQNKIPGTKETCQSLANTGEACMRWLRCSVRPDEGRHGYEEWVKRCPSHRCGKPISGANLHCDKHRKIWISRLKAILKADPTDFTQDNQRL